jgi:putative FmdB family regulatory protein
MPIYNYICLKCGTKKARLRAPKDEDKKATCPNCPEDMVRDHGGPTSKIVEVRDNGVMGKAVEQVADAERLYYERAHIPESKFRKF